jgi:hypothetical protein
MAAQAHFGNFPTTTRRENVAIMVGKLPKSL